MIYADGYSIEQYPNRNYIKITLPPTAKTAISTLLGARLRKKETLTNDELTVILVAVKWMYEWRGERREDDG